MFSSALPYDPRWAAKLLRRDLRDIKTKAVDKFKARFGRSKSTLPLSTEHIDVVIVEPEAPHVSESPAPTPPTAARSAFFDTLEGHLRTLWDARDRNTNLDDRWYFRGSWLVLVMALQTWPWGTSYGIFDGPKVDVEALLTEITELAMAKASRTPRRVEKMTDEPFLRAPNRPRFDSLFGEGPPGVYVDTKTTPAHLWCGILEAAKDETKTIEIVEELLTFVWPDVHVPKLIAEIGNPAKRFREDEELRHALRGALFPEYDTISSAPLH